MKKIFVLLTSLMAIPVLASCGQTKTYVVDFNSNGGTHIEFQKVNEGEIAHKPADPTKTDYVFSGWFINQDFSGEIFDFSTPIKADTVLYAKWNGGPVIEHNVNFDSCGGSYVPSQKVKHNEKVVLPEVAPTKDGYTFEAWYITATFEGTPYDFDTPVADNLTLFAKFNRNAVMYNFNFKGEHCYLNNDPTYEEGRKVELVFSIDNGYHLPDKINVVGTSEYTYNKNNKTLILTVNSDISVFANAEQDAPVNRYYVCFATNGATSGLVDYQYVAEGEKAYQPEGVTKTGCFLKGWVVDEKYDYDGLFDFNAPVTKDYALYAWWETLKYEVVFYDGNEVLEDLKQNVSYNSLVIRPADLTKSNFIFDDFYADEFYKTKFDFNKPLTGENRLIKIYGKFDEKEYRVVFNPTGGTIEGDNYIDVPFNHTIDQPPVISRPGYDCSKVKWSLTADGSEPFYFGNGGTLVSASLQLYAQWEDATIVDVAFDANGGYFDQTRGLNYKTIPTKYGKKPVAPTPVRDSDTFYIYEFGGWDKEISEATTFVTYVAVWKVSQVVCDVIFNTNGGTLTSGSLSHKVNAGNTIPKNLCPQVSKEGYGEPQWYTDAVGGTLFKFDESKVTSNLVLYARWENRTRYFVTLKLNGCKMFDGNTEILDKTICLNANESKSFRFESVTKGFSVDAISDSKCVSYNPHSKTLSINQINQDLTIVANERVHFDLNELSWDSISRISDEGRASYYFQIGDIKTVIVNSIAHTVRIIDFNHDTIFNSGGKKAGITFDFADLISDSNGHSIGVVFNWEQCTPYGTEPYTYQGSNLSKALDGTGTARDFAWYEKEAEYKSTKYTLTVFDMLPADLRSVLKPVKNNNKLFALSYQEYKNYGTIELEEDGFGYEYYKSNYASLLKRQVAGFTGSNKTPNIKDAPRDRCYGPIRDGAPVHNNAGLGCSDKKGGFYWTRSVRICNDYHHPTWMHQSAFYINDNGDIQVADRGWEVLNAVAPGFAI